LTAGVGSEGAGEASRSAVTSTVVALPDPAALQAMQTAILEWYAATARPLAFRGTSDPYAILVSELMAQQTQAGRAAEAWRGFLATFPTFAALAAATPAAVLRAWRGLGYNRRALALRRIAIAVVDDHGGRLPSDLGALEQLPGIGPYTARALAALAFGQPVGPIDTNVRRVLRRALLGRDPVRPGDARVAGEPTARELQELADAVVPAGRPGEWTHALMDIGATLCRSGTPRCDGCPVRPWCRWAAAATHQPAAPPRPSATPKPASPHPHATASSAAARARGHRASEPKATFQASSRWLRGRIVERLCAAPDGDWVTLDERIGAHDAAAVEQALEALARDRLIERHPSLARHARLPLA
jgi:A/G-specific adenine glycosylase